MTLSSARRSLSDSLGAPKVTAMSDIPLIDYASLDEQTRQRLAAVIATHTSLERALNWSRTQRPPLAVEAILTQDEYTHDVLIPFENRYLVYDTT